MRIPLPVALSVATALGAGLGACATAPTPLQGSYAPLQPEQAVARGGIGETVRWGGRIVAVRTEKLHSCFEIVGAPLDSGGRPRKVDQSTGRFIACRTGFYDPQVFAAGRELTVSGRIDGFEEHKIGDYDYRYPRVAADVVYLWPPRRERDDWHVQPYFGVGWGWYQHW